MKVLLFFLLAFLFNPVLASSILHNKMVKFSCQHTESEVQAAGAQSLVVENDRIYIGTRQVSNRNQNPIMRRFGRKKWCREDYETTGADGRGMGLLWENGRLYGVFTADGTQGDKSQDYRRFTHQGWLNSYGNGGGAKVAVVLEINPNDGQGIQGSFISAIKSDGKTNSLAIKDLCFNSAGNLLIRANSWYSPRKPNKSALNNINASSSPHDYSLEMTADLSQVIASAAINWGGGGVPNGVPQHPDGCSQHPYIPQYNSMGLSATFQPLTSSTHFVNRIHTEKQTFLHHATLPSTQTLEIQSEIQVDPQHQGQAAGLIVVAIFNNTLFSRTGNHWQPWSGLLNELGIAESRASLKDVENLLLFQGRLTGSKGLLTLFVGYQFESGTIFYNQYQPITIILE